MSARAEIEQALQSGAALRLHTREGEVLVARVIDCDDRELRYTVVRSSHPERYAVCDSTGFCLPLDAIVRATPLSDAQADRSGRRQRS